MKSVGGNTTATIQIMQITTTLIGEQIPSWTDAILLNGWLDLLNGDSRISTYDAKIQESTHVFICDSTEMAADTTSTWKWDSFSFIKGIIPQIDGQAKVEATPENTRMIINGKRYAITMIDDPMCISDHLQIFLKYAGGQ